MNCFARVITILCFLWLLSFVVFGGTSVGHSWFREISQNLSDNKGAVPVVALAIPVLVAGSVCSILLQRKPEVRSSSTSGSSGTALPHQLPALFHRCIHSVLLCCRWPLGDANFDVLAFLFIFLPLLVYIISSTYRKLHGSSKDGDYKVKEIGNIFGIAAMIALSIFLIPVARHSSIVKLIGWNPARAVRLHIWTSRFVVGSMAAHGCLHMLRWKVYANESILAMLLPPRQCWTLRDNDFSPTCGSLETDCSCYDHFRNLTGILGGLGFMFILLTSLDSVRRRCYAFFYKSHVLGGPMVLLLVAMHWNRSILYMAGGLLYYVGSSFVILTESRTCCRRDGGVRIVSAERIPATQQQDSVSKQQTNGNHSSKLRQQERCCISLTLEASNAAIQRYRAGQYVKLAVPEVSCLSHPFSINLIPGKSNQVRLLFRATGPFTLQLVNKLLSSDTKLPRIVMDGYHGPPDRLHCALQHDVVLFVAGGIGITPFLSLLHKLHLNLTGVEGRPFLFTKRVVLHWICRDAALIDYVKREYFDPLLMASSNYDDEKENSTRSLFQMRIVMHWTGAFDCSNLVEPAKGSHSDCHDPNTNGALVGSQNSAWIGLLGVWNLYTHVQQEHEVLSRILAPLFIVLLGIVTAALMQFVFGVFWSDSDPPFLSVEWSRVKSRILSNDGYNQEMQQLSQPGNDQQHHLQKEDAMTDISRTSPSPDNSSTSNFASPNVCLEEREGRPAVRDLIKSALEGAKQPGLFACGPISLMQAIRESIQDDGCSLQISPCGGKRAAPIVFHEESFHM